MLDTEDVRPLALRGLDQPPYVGSQGDGTHTDFLGPQGLDDTMSRHPLPSSCDIHADTGNDPDPAPPEHRQPVKEYGEQWDWDSDLQDYVRYTKDGNKILYTTYQREGSPPASSTQPGEDQQPESQVQPKSPELASIKVVKPAAPSYDQPLGDEFQVVAKPKRFFSVGRIFKTAWFEPGATDPPAAPRPKLNAGAGAGSAEPPWSTKCPPFHGERPIARFRWFVVVRRRLHHSLCFSITTFAGSKAGSRGRPGDYVVLHNSNVEPARPYPEEEITRDPIAVIIEDGEHFIAPIARLDCGRIYTVEDNLRVFKIGRVHPSSLQALDDYYRESMA
ncbi:hypothetical protein N658DRAFT_494868 [Parathielavia hyrcaniae]|uniref:DUF6590 domain-containing protein n=1 Tax=Parathielavia hyrcaniae TaxID=113614 RepID=A0AAN6T2W6_9PEZI|nr:hypothetical protein N658DRAFT_494868 [Parathielavia hyrcaniae]